MAYEIGFHKPYINILTKNYLFSSFLNPLTIIVESA